MVDVIPAVVEGLLRVESEHDLGDLARHQTLSEADLDAAIQILSSDPYAREVVLPLQRSASHDGIQPMRGGGSWLATTPRVTSIPYPFECTSLLVNPAASAGMVIVNWGATLTKLLSKMFPDASESSQ